MREPFLRDPDCSLFLGDALEVLAELPDGCVDCCVTSPPYLGLRDYGVEGQLGLEASIGEYVDRLVAIFGEVRRVLADHGTVWLNLGDSYNAYNGGAGPGSKLSRIQTLARPRLDTGFGLQQKELKPKDLLGAPWRVAFALQADGWYLRSDIVWSKPNPMPESVTDRPTKSHEYVFLLSKQPRYFFDQEAVREEYGAGCRCDECRAACREAARRMRASGAAPNHGTLSGYKNYGCRCEPCKAAAVRANRKARAYKRKWYAANREKISAWSRAYHAANREEKNAKTREWKRKNRARLLEQQRTPEAKAADRRKKLAYLKKNPHKRREWDAKRRALKRGARVETVDPEVVFERDDFLCQICGKQTFGQYPDPQSPSLDHIVPLSKGGEHSYGNVQCAHLRCNLQRGTNDLPTQLRLLG